MSGIHRIKSFNGLMGVLAMKKILALGVALLFLSTTIVSASIPKTTKVSSNDTTAGYLNGKLVEGTGVDFTENSDGGNETLTISLLTSSINWDSVSSAIPSSAMN